MIIATITSIGMPKKAEMVSTAQIRSRMIAETKAVPSANNTATKPLPSEIMAPMRAPMRVQSIQAMRYSIIVFPILVERCIFRVVLEFVSVRLNPSF